MRGCQIPVPRVNEGDLTGGACQLARFYPPMAYLAESTVTRVPLTQRRHIRGPGPRMPWPDLSHRAPRSAVDPWGGANDGATGDSTYLRRWMTRGAGKSPRRWLCFVV